MHKELKKVVRDARAAGLRVAAAQGGKGHLKFYPPEREGDAVIMTASSTPSRPTVEARRLRDKLRQLGYPI